MELVKRLFFAHHILKCRKIDDVGRIIFFFLKKKKKKKNNSVYVSNIVESYLTHDKRTNSVSEGLGE